MFYWIQTRFQKHFKWLFVIILALVSVSFVFTVGNHSPLDAGARGGVEVNNFYGVNLNSRPELEPFIRNASITSVIDTGRPLSPQQSGMAIQSRIAFLWLANEVNLPSPSKTELQAYLKDRNIFKNPDGSFNVSAYDRFRKEFLPNYKYSEQDFVALMEENYRIEKVRNLASGPGFTLPLEAKYSLEDRRTAWSIDVASLSLREFDPEIEVTDEELNTFYFDRQSNYQRPASIVGTALVFPFSKYTANLPAPTDEQFEVFFSLNEFKFDQYRPEEVDGETAEFVWTSVPREALINAYNLDAAQPMAEKEAQAFVLQLHEKNVGYQDENFKLMLDQADLTLSEAETFTENNSDAMLVIPSSLRKQLFTLQGRRYFSDPFAVQDGIVVAFTSEYIPAEIPALEEVKDVVIVDFKESKKALVFKEQGDKLAEAMQSLDTAEAFAEKAGEENFVLVSYDSFTSSELPSGLSSSVLSNIQNLSAKDVSEFIQVGDEGYVVFIKEKIVPEIAADDSELAESLEQTAQFSQQINQYLLTKELIEEGNSQGSEEL